MDPIQEFLAKLQAAHATPAADATGTGGLLGQFAGPPANGIGPQMPHTAQPMGGLLGRFMQAGESVHNGLVARKQAGLKPEDYAMLAMMAAEPALKGAGDLAGMVGESIKPTSRIVSPEPAAFFNEVMQARKNMHPDVYSRSVESLMHALPNGGRAVGNAFETPTMAAMAEEQSPALKLTQGGGEAGPSMQFPRPQGAPPTLRALADSIPSLLGKFAGHDVGALADQHELLTAQMRSTPGLGEDWKAARDAKRAAFDALQRAKYPYLFPPK